MNQPFSTRCMLPVALAAALLVAACGNSDPSAMLSSARDYLGKNDAPAAIIQLKNALQEDPDLGEARLLLGQALLSSGDPVGAETELKKAADLGVSPDLFTPALVRSRLMLRASLRLNRQLAAPILDRLLEKLPGDHHFGGDYDRLAEVILKGGA